MEAWRRCFRDGFAPQLSTKGLEALALALENDDERLMQGATTSPLPLQCSLNRPVEKACAVSYTYWQGEGLVTVYDVEELFAHACFEADTRLGEPAACRFFLNWWDEAPREDARMELLGEVRRELTGRASQPRQG